MRRRVWFALGALGSTPLLLFLLLRVGLLTPVFNFILAHELKGRSPLQVRVGVLRTDLLSFVEADDVMVMAPIHGAAMPLATLATLRVEYQGWQSLRGRVDWQETVRLARVRGLNLFMLREASGAWNLSVLAESKSGTHTAHSRTLPLIPASRVELEDSQIVLNDERRGFHTTLQRLQGSLDTRALPLVAFSLNGRTEGHAKENLSLAGELDQRDGRFFGRVDLANVELARYLNYFLPGKGLVFTGGTASLSVRLNRESSDEEMSASGRADLVGGVLQIPGVSVPLSGLHGAVSFSPEALRFKEVQARFLGSDWTAGGAIVDLRKPQFQIQLLNPAFPLAALSQQVKGAALLALSGTAALQATMTGPAHAPDINAVVAAPVMGIFGVELNDVKAKARLQGSQLTVSELSADLWDGRLDGSARLGLGKDGQLHAELQVDGAKLELARLRGRKPLPLAGTAWLGLKASGLLHSPNLELSLEVAHTTLGTLPLGNLEASANLSPKGLDTHFKALQGNLEGRIATKGPDATYHDSKIVFKQMDLSATARGLATAGDSLVLPASAVKVGQMLDGVLAGNLNATLSLVGPRKAATIWIDTNLSKGRLYTPDGLFGLRDANQGLDLRLVGSIGLRTGELLLGKPNNPLRLNFGRRGKGLEFLALGRFPLKPTAPAGKLELVLDGDLKVLDAMQLFEKSQGKLTADLTLGGTPDAPQAQGDLKLTSFSTIPSAFLAPLKDGTLVVRFHGQNIDVEKLAFQSGGQVSATGQWDLSAGLRGLQGSLTVNTDSEGLRLQNWDAMGSGNLVLAPLQLNFYGEEQPWKLAGRVSLSNALVVYGGRPKPADGAPVAPKKSRPMSLDLRVGLGANVWYEKRQSKSVDILDPTKWITGIADSAIETLQRPDIFFRLKPTDNDFLIQGTTPDIGLFGELGIDRGRLTIMENSFEIKPDRAAALVRFSGKHAEITAEALARLRYTRDDPLTHRPFQKAVNVIAQVRPLSPEELEKSNAAESFLNYNLTFKSEPEIVPGNDAQQNAAILNLVVLGDPMVDLDAQTGGAQQGSASSLGETQLNRIISAEARKQIDSLSKKGFKFLGSKYFDVFRVVPHVKYQAVGPGPAAEAAAGAATGGAPGTASPAQDMRWGYDFTVEMGKSFFEQLYVSATGIYFGQDATGATAANNTLVAGQSNYVTRNYGARLGAEYQITGNRTLEAFYNYSVDDNLEPVAYDPANLAQAHSGVVRLRNTISTGNYSAAQARERRWDQEEEEESKP